MALGERPLLPVRQRLDARGRHPGVHQVVARRVRALLAQRLVVLDRPALVAVALERDAHVRLVAQQLRGPVQRHLRVIAQRVGVQVEERVGEIARRHGGHRDRGLGRHRRRRRRGHGLHDRRGRRRRGRRFHGLLGAARREQASEPHRQHEEQCRGPSHGLPPGFESEAFVGTTAVIRPADGDHDGDMAVRPPVSSLRGGRPSRSEMNRA